MPFLGKKSFISPSNRRRDKDASRTTGYFCSPAHGRGHKETRKNFAGFFYRHKKILDKILSCAIITALQIKCAAVAHLVERHLAKVEVASSSLVSRSIFTPRPLGGELFCCPGAFISPPKYLCHDAKMMFRGGIHMSAELYR